MAQQPRNIPQELQEQQKLTNYGTLAGVAGGSAIMLALLKEWGQSEAEKLRKLQVSGRPIPTRVHPAILLASGALLGLAGKQAYDKYKEWKATQYY